MRQMVLDFLTPQPAGVTFDAALDGARLGAQHAAVLELMRDGKWRSLEEIARTTGHPEASVSARLRDFRKEAFGEHQVDRCRRGAPERGVWVYRLTERARPATVSTAPKWYEV